MTPIDLERVRTIAHKTRTWAEKVQKKFPLAYTSNLCGLCAIASGHLHKNLRKEGYDSVLALYQDDFNGHCFILLGGYVIDVTATQFSNKYPKVHIERYTEMHKRDKWWRAVKTSTSRIKLKKFQIKNNWCRDEIVAASHIRGA